VELLIKTSEVSGQTGGYNKGSSNNLYVRELRNILTEDGEEVPCWIYIYANEKYAKENGILVPDGNWRNFMKRKIGMSGL